MTDYDNLYSAPESDMIISVASASRVRASFRLFHEELDPERVTDAFGAIPTISHRKGDQRTGKSGRIYSPYREGGWILSSKDKVRSCDANDHILWILDQLAHCTTALHRYQQEGYNADIACFWLALSDNTFPILNAETIRRLARYRLKCWFDVYLFPPDD